MSRKSKLTQNMDKRYLAFLNMYLYDPYQAYDSPLIENSHHKASHNMLTDELYLLLRFIEDNSLMKKYMRYRYPLNR